MVSTGGNEREVKDNKGVTGGDNADEQNKHFTIWLNL